MPGLAERTVRLVELSGPIDVVPRGVHVPHRQPVVEGTAELVCENLRMGNGEWGGA